MPAVLPAKKADVARRGHMKRWVMAALQDGGLTMSELVRQIAQDRPDLSHKAVYQRTGQCLARLKKTGKVRRDGRVWSLVNRLCCTNPMRDSSRESSMVAGWHEQTDTPDLQDPELASV